MSRKFLQARIVEKMYSEDEYKAFLEKYNSFLTPKGVREVTEQDRQIYADFQAGMKVAAIKSKYGITHSRVMTSIVRALKG